jgi:hypothetical protein
MTCLACLSPVVWSLLAAATAPSSFGPASVLTLPTQAMRRPSLDDGRPAVSELHCGRWSNDAAVERETSTPVIFDVLRLERAGSPSKTSALTSVPAPLYSFNHLGGYFPLKGQTHVNRRSIGALTHF